MMRSSRWISEGFYRCGLRTRLVPCDDLSCGRALTQSNGPKMDVFNIFSTQIATFFADVTKPGPHYVPPYQSPDVDIARH